MKKSHFQQDEKRSGKKSFRYYLITFFWLFVVFGFFFLVMLLSDRGAGETFRGSGTGLAGSGSGAGSYGTGTGAGDTGKGAGKSEKASQKTGVAAVESPSDDGGKDKESSKVENPAESSVKEETAQREAKTDVQETTPAGANGVLKDNDRGKDIVFHPVSENFSEPAPVDNTVFKRKDKNEPDIPDSETPAPSVAGTASNSGASGVSGKKNEGFYGIKTSGNTLFVVDVSGSMSSSSTEGVKINILKQQLKNAIKSHAKDVHGKSDLYGIVAFPGRYSSCEFFPAQGKMKHFSNVLDKETENYIDNLYPCGGTPLHEAMIEVGKLIKSKEISVNTIFILTDGEPNSTWEEIFDCIKNDIPRNIVINTISIGRDCPEMKKIAKDRKGNYRKCE